MTDSDHNVFLLKDSIIYSLKVYMWISLGIFLFILFFQPFTLTYEEFNNILLFDAGCGAIVFVLLSAFYVILPMSFTRLFSLEKYEISLYNLISICYVVICTTSFTFYIRYVGKSELSMFYILKISMVCTTPAVLLVIIRENESLKKLVANLRESNIKLRLQLGTDQEASDTHITFSSDNRSEKIDLPPEDVLLIRSAENYVGILYKHDEENKQMLLRTTLKNIEEQLREYPGFLRCHRTCIVNTKYILKLDKNLHGYHLKMLNFEDGIPVSRQYLVSVREALGMT